MWGVGVWQTWSTVAKGALAKTSGHSGEQMQEKFSIFSAEHPNRELRKAKAYTLLEKCWQISLYVSDDAISKLYVT